MQWRWMSVTLALVVEAMAGKMVAWGRVAGDEFGGSRGNS
jgi:hypothetical protein